MEAVQPARHGACIENAPLRASFHRERELLQSALRRALESTSQCRAMKVRRQPEAITMLRERHNCSGGVVLSSTLQSDGLPCCRVFC